MLPLRAFRVHEPKNLQELAAVLNSADAKTRIIAGGTDILPNLKHGLYDCEQVISLRALKELLKIDYDEVTRSLSIGAGIKLAHLQNNPLVVKFFPALGYAASAIASPQIRAMGTVGGNICLDTRCLYFNQSEFWRRSLGYCLKKDGTACHVVKTGKRCVAASSNDLATILLALNAQVAILSAGEERLMDLDDFYINNGLKNNKLSSQEIITKVIVEHQSKSYAGFAKLRHRESIDFSLLSIGVAFGLEEGLFTHLRIAVNALVAKPRVFDLSDERRNSSYQRAQLEEIAEEIAFKCHPQTNICDDPSWRKEMIKCYIIKAFENAKNIE